MEDPDSRGSTDGRPTSFQGEKVEPRSVVVAVDATRELQLAALEYALKNCVRTGDNLYLLGILHEVSNPMGYKQKADSKNFNGTNKNKIQEEILKKHAEFQNVITDHPELQKLFDSKQVKPELHITAGSSRKEVTAKEAGELGAAWVILDKPSWKNGEAAQMSGGMEIDTWNLKKDKAYLVEKLNCNIVLMKPKKEFTIHRVELRADNEIGNLPGRSIDLPVDPSASPLDQFLPSIDHMTVDPSAAPIGQYTDSSLRGFPNSVAQSRLSNGFDAMHKSSAASDSVTGSPEAQHGTATVYRRGSTMTESHSSLRTQLSLHAEEAAVESDQEVNSKMVLKVEKESIAGENFDTVAEHGTAPSLSSAAAETVVSAGSPHLETAHKAPGRPTPTGDSQSLMARQPAPPVLRPVPRSANEIVADELMKIFNPSNSPPSEPPVTESLRTLQRSLRDEDLSPESPTTDNSAIGRPFKFGNQNEETQSSLDDSPRSKKKNQRPAAPLCSKCNHPGPVFGSEAIKFTYAQLEEATNNFDQENYLAEGGYGFVYRGTLKDSGQEIAVKQYKPASSQGDDEFYSEVNVLKFAQHRNLVILIGYCAEKNKRLLVYEFVCNKSLDVHLSAKNAVVLEWKSRWKIAVGAARGLRYLHEECRVGCIVHRDMRPNNILCTHDFVPMVGDFGLARSQTNGDNPEETRVIGTLGYLAPEYAESGSITEKADVYSFGVVLLELITGRKAIDATKPRGEMCLTEWARPKIQAGETRQIVDPRLKDAYDIEQVNKMVDAAGGCICRDPSQRPKMSEVLRILERDANASSMSRDSSSNDLSDIFSRNPPRAFQSGKLTSRQNSLEGGKASAKMIANYSHKEHNSSVPGAIPRKPSKEHLNTSERTQSPRPVKQYSGKALNVSSSPVSKNKGKAAKVKGAATLKYFDML